jgi:hypothetical protein
MSGNADSVQVHKYTHVGRVAHGTVSWGGPPHDQTLHDRTLHHHRLQGPGPQEA